MTDFDALITGTGFLTDRQIAIALQAGFLIDQGSWDQTAIRHASYTLRLGDKVEIARRLPAATTERKEFSVVRLQPGGSIDISPGDTALLFSLEHIRLPSCVLGFTVARGLLFAEALSPENTYIDPGFAGPLYTTVTNVSSRVVTLEYGVPLARLFFFRLSEAAQDGYRAGSAIGITQQLNSVRAVEIATPAQAESAEVAQLLSVVQQLPIGGVHTAEILKRHALADRRLLILSIAYPPLLVLANSSTWVAQHVSSFLANVLASLVAAVLTLLGPRFLRWIGFGK